MEHSAACNGLGRIACDSKESEHSEALGRDGLKAWRQRDSRQT